ncbi:glycogen/starch synthase, ADP-glucose type [Pseudopedobacter saltans DSM 12145]|uniref:Glycogen synthase n=1 Tax=Pseudopedobacter saltans (strain ATCC 51119 / DSM 12145 / JCM 21818 / CCUG 39354 / LMG 10337 / NBRC 100064 / NCIMB 13643) TaxID=762903 RepID=F0S6M2_PSESL|nr:glycogen/starch synthase [Pseudopedobacter saltans]ADY51098.1 glycogen/starch synthase, ADP-glucose type [Pseudopedobacter saltans DSM 12145]
MTKVIHLSVECYPIAKVGGLADVVGALPKYQQKLGIDASVVMPWYDRPFLQQHQFEIAHQGSFYQGSELLDFQIYKEKENSLGFELYLIKIPGKLDRSEVYCYPDEGEQFIAFQHAFLQWLKDTDTIPDIIHCHDHHVGLIPFLVKHSKDFSFLSASKTVVTVHNGQYQGWMNWNKGILLPSFDTWKWGLLDWDGMINPLATAIKCCDAYTTVSEGYLEELYKAANGLESLFSNERQKSYGIVNGIDTEIWNPETDTSLTKNYSVKNVKTGKVANKKQLCKEYKLNPRLPLLTFIGRFATEKGADLLPEILHHIFKENEDKLSIFILGSGDQQIQSHIQKLAEPFSGELAVYFGYDENLAHRIYASADFILMPSRVEPCGLNQLYAMKYGTLPIVNNVGGLKDTVLDINDPNGYGVVFQKADVQDICYAVKRALDYFEQEDLQKKNQQRMMLLDFSWEKSAQKYLNLYSQLLK